MISGLVSIIRELHGEQQTGMLTLNADGANSLFKMYFKEGDIYHIAYQDTQNSQCLDLIDILDFNSCGFLPKVKLNKRRQNLPTTAEIIRYCEMSAASILTSKGRIVDAECVVEKTDIRPIVEDDQDLVGTLEDVHELFENNDDVDKAATSSAEDPPNAKGKSSSKDQTTATNTRITFERAKEIQEELTVALIRQIGPAGKKISQNIITEKWKPFSPKNPTTHDCKVLVEMLLSEIEDRDYQEEFRKESSLILNL